MEFDIWGETARLAFRKMSPEDFSEIAKIMHGENVQQIWEYYFSDDDIKNWIKKTWICIIIIISDIFWRLKKTVKKLSDKLR